MAITLNSRTRLPIGYVVSCWAVGAAVYVVGVLVFRHADDVPAPLLYAWFVGIPILMAVVPVLAYISYRQGPRFLIDRAKSTFTLPNVQKSWPLADIIGWQIVNYVRGTDRGENYRSQLILVVRQESAVARYPVFTGIGRGMERRLRELVEQVAVITPLRLVSHVEDGADRANSPKRG